MPLRSIASRLGWLGPCLLAFFASFCVMVIELVAGRLIARHVGFSIYTWTSVIGVILAGIMCGNFIGGRLADRFNPRRTASLLLLLAAAASLAIPPLDYQFGDLELLVSVQSWPMRILGHVTGVFLLPATALGLIGPVVAKMALDRSGPVGRTVGNVYGWGAFGSIVGTFATGFVLIGRFGSVSILVGVALLLIALAIATWPFWPAAGGAVLVLLGFAPVYGTGPWMWTFQNGRIAVRTPCTNCVWMNESRYSFIRITDESVTGARELVLDDLIHAYYVPGHPEELRYSYERVYAAATARAVGGRERLRAFFVGGGGYTFPRYLADRWPFSVIEIAEIDADVTRADVAAFGLDPTRLRFGRLAELAGTRDRVRGAIDISHLDARNALAELVAARRAGTLEPFDVVYGDAFQNYSVPFHLVTREFDEGIRAILNPDSGLYLLNVIDIFAEGRFVGAVYNTMRSVFPHVYVVASDPQGLTDERNERCTFVVIGAQRALDMGNLDDSGNAPPGGYVLDEAHLERLQQRSGGMVLTDDYSPVDNLMEVVVRRRGLSRQDR